MRFGLCCDLQYVSVSKDAITALHNINSNRMLTMGENKHTRWLGVLRNDQLVVVAILGEVQHQIQTHGQESLSFALGKPMIDSIEIRGLRLQRGVVLVVATLPAVMNAEGDCKQ